MEESGGYAPLPKMSGNSVSVILGISPIISNVLYEVTFPPRLAYLWGPFVMTPLATPTTYDQPDVQFHTQGHTCYTALHMKLGYLFS